MLLTGSPTNWNSENEIMATTSMTKTACTSRWTMKSSIDSNPLNPRPGYPYPDSHSTATQRNTAACPPNSGNLNPAVDNEEAIARLRKRDRILRTSKPPLGAWWLLRRTRDHGPGLSFTIGVNDQSRRRT
jgi:hypothetical protein